MKLQDLPPELFYQIVHDLVDSAGVRHAWDLRGVSRTFATAIKYDVLVKQPTTTFPTEYDRRVLVRFADMWFVNRIKAPLDANHAVLAKFKDIITFLVQKLEISDPQREEYTKQFCSGLKNVAGIANIIHAFCCHNSDCWSNDWSAWISQGVDTDDKLWASVAMGNHGLVQKLLPSLELKQRSRLCRFDAFEIAILQCDEKLIETILKYLESIRFTDPATADELELDRFNRGSLSINGAICTAIENNKLEVLQILLEFHAKNVPSASPSTWDGWFKTAIVYGKRLKGEINQIASLGAVLDYELEEKSRVCRGSLKYVFTYGTRAMIDEVLSRWTVDINTGTVITLPICIAVRVGSQLAVDALIDAGADINITFASNRRSTPKDRERPIDLAIQDHQLRIIVLLANHGATIPYSSEWPTHKRTYSLLCQIVLDKKNVRLPQLPVFKRLSLAKRKELEA